MPISFEIPETIAQTTEMAKMAAEYVMRPISREMDEQEHARPTPFIENTWPIMRDMTRRTLERAQNPDAKKSGRPSIANLRLMMMIEMLSWGDAGIYLCLPGGALGGAAIEATGTTEQKVKFLSRFAEGDTPAWGAMAMTEPGAGSDTSAIQTTATFDEATNEWIINGEKIFCTNGKLALDESNGLVVVWASIDRSTGRAGMRPFVVEAGTPGVKVAKVEIKHGIRASDTAAIVFDNARIPADHLLGSAEVSKPGESAPGGKGFRGAMATFDATRPLVAASALGIGRASLEFLKEKLAESGVDIPYGAPYHTLTAIQRDVLEMEAQLHAAYLLTLRAITMLDAGEPNSLEASMAKAKAGKVVTQIAQKTVELLGASGYSREWLAEKWMRDARINGIYEGTDQINTLIVARRILEYSSRELN